MIIRVSWATAQKLGILSEGKGPECRTAYLLTQGKCDMTCAFCPQARTSSARPDQLSRIIWPAFELDNVVNHLDGGPEFERICVQSVANSRTPESLQYILKNLRRLVRACPPISVSFRPRRLSDVDEIFDLGAERIGIALDAATPEVYSRIKGPDFARHIELIQQAASRYPGKISTHLIAGLGETERELVTAIQFMKDIGVTVGLFAFTPVRGTPLAGHPRPELASYRRIQAAHYLIMNGRIRAEDLSFDGGRIIGFGVGEEELVGCLSSGEAFRTSGCPGCDRPFYNESPSGPFYNYWRPLPREEIQKAIGAVLSGLSPSGSSFRSAGGIG